MKIVSATITGMPQTIVQPMPVVTTTFDNGETRKLFAYYPDEISFTADEFIGLTLSEARALKVRKDKAWLQSGIIK